MADITAGILIWRKQRHKVVFDDSMSYQITTASPSSTNTVQLRPSTWDKDKGTSTGNRGDTETGGSLSLFWQSGQRISSDRLVC